MTRRRIQGAVLFILVAGSLLAGFAGETEPPGEPTTTVELLRAQIRQGRYAEAEAAARELLAAVESSRGRDSAEAAGVLDVLVEARWRSGKAQEPESFELAERALRIKQDALGGGDPGVAESLNNLAVMHFFAGQYTEARRMWSRALEIRTASLGMAHPDTAQSMNNLANLLQTIGDYGEARLLYERALAAREEALGPDDPYVAQSLSNLAVLLKTTGDYARARPLYERALEIYATKLGDDHPKVASTLNGLGGLLWHMGARDEAWDAFERSQEILEKRLGEEHPQVAASLNNVAELLRNEGDYARARPLYERALAIWEGAFGPDHWQVALCLDNLGDLLYESGDLDAARPVFERAAAIREEALGPQHPSVAESLNSLAKLLGREGERDKARALFDRAVSIREKSLGPQHPYVAESLNDLATLLARGGDTHGALEQALASERIGRDHLRLTTRSLPESQALSYASVRNTGLDVTLSLAARRLDPAETRRTFDALVRSRAVVLDEMAARSRTASTAADPELSRLASALATARARLANLTVKGLGRLEPADYRRLLDEARKEKEQAERALAEASVEFAQEQQRSRLGLAEVASSLPRDTALVAFSLYDRDDLRPASSNAPEHPAPEDPVASYIAFVLRAGAENPAAVDLGPAAEIDGAIAVWKQEVARGTLSIRRTPEQAEAAYREAGGALRERVWDPIVPHLKDSRRVLVVPDGAINLVSFAALPRGASKYLIETGPWLHYLSAERDVVPVPSKSAVGQGLLVLGGPDYDDATLFAAGSIGPGNPGGGGPTDTPVEAVPGRRSSCGSFDTMRFAPLPEAVDEAAEIVSLWKQGHVEGAESEGILHLTGSGASEAAFKSAAGGRRVLHLATHGFFLGGDCSGSGQGSRGLTIKTVDKPAPVVPLIKLSPLLLSGLAMAGANHRQSAGAQEQDGILTAEEIAGLDLSSVEWAVLSACDTGVGEIQAGEGVFGLRRAIQVAGVRTLLMSLWPVDDRATRLWMNFLYSERLLRGRDTIEAVRAAGLSVLEQRRESGDSTHPYYWAAFVAAGDWR